jgi:glycosyltransferase involved in cell wall biosynthesis
MSERMPRVTLAMPVYNGERFLRDAVESVLSQTFTDFELIITDNCSTDSTETICRGLAARDARIRYYRNQRNTGAADNFNLGFELARGRYLKWCAHDDLISADHLSYLTAALDADPSASLAYGRTICIDADNKIIPLIGEEMQESSSLDAIERFSRVITRPGTCFPIFGLFRMQLLRRTTLHRPYYGSDRALLAEAALLGRFRCVSDAVFYNRDHEQRSINISNKLVRSCWQNGAANKRAASEHLNLLFHLYEVAGRHPDVASKIRARLHVAKFAARPLQVSRYASEALCLLSPSLARELRSLIRPNKTNHTLQT